MASEFIGQRPPHTALPNWLRGKATPLELATLWALQSHWPNIHPSLSLLAEEACISRRSVCTVLAGMERKGWLVRDHAFDGGGRKTSNRYRLTIWDIRWFSVDGAADALAQEVHHRTGQSVVQEVHLPSAGGAHKEDQSKKNRFKPLEPPLPPSGGSAGQDQLEAVAVEVLPPAAAVPKGPEGGMVSEPPPPTMTPTKSRRRRFEPCEDFIPFELMPVAPEILGFWATKAGARSEKAWNGLITQLSLIQDDPQGGTEALRSQLQQGIDRASIKPWMSVTHSLWRTYGLRSTQAAFSRRQTPEEAAMESIAFIKTRDAKRTAAAAAAASQTVVCEVLA